MRTLIGILTTGTVVLGACAGNGLGDIAASISATDILVPPQGYGWYAPLFASCPSNADEFGNLYAFPCFPTPQAAGTGYCQSVVPTWTAQVSCGPGQQFPCGFACFDENGTFRGGTALDEAAICPFNSIPELSTVDGSPNIVCRIAGLVPPKNTGCPDCDTTGGTDPIHLGIGNSYQLEPDYVGTGVFPLHFERHYNSNGAATHNDINFNSNGNEVQRYLSPRWKHGYDRSIVVHRRTPSIAKSVRPDGRQVFFRRTGGVFLPESDGLDRLERQTDALGNLIGWRLTIGKDDSVETYDASGRLLSIGNRAGLRQTLTYEPAGRLASVSDPFGATLGFGYNARGQLVTLTDPAGQLYTYGYDGLGRLVSVTYPDTQVRRYLYETAGFAEGLTAIIDEMGARYASWTYDSHGRAISSEHAGGVDRVTAVDAAHVIDAFNNTRSFGLQNIVGVAKTTGITGPACPSCGPAAQTYDANGNVTSRTDWNGNRTSYTYDLTRNLETSRTEGLTSAGAATPQTRTITTEWDANVRMPRRIAEPLRITTSAYDPDGTQCGARGALCSKTIQATTDASGSQGFAATPIGAPRTWTNTYNTSGQILTVDGPRTDVADTTTYTYHAVSDADLGKRGHVATITDAAGHVTVYAAYNPHGQPLTIVDPNGLTTTMTYDARQRLTSRSVGGETTSYEYDAAGQLTKATQPDGSFVSYRHDAAHRLTGLQDNLGNRITYTLDLMGNRTREQVFDPTNQLAQTHSRVYSNLNQLVRELGATGQTTELTYDRQGNVTAITDPLNHLTVKQYDPLNRLKQVTDPLNGVIQHAYNGLDALTQLTDPRNLVTTYRLDGVGNLNQQVSPDTGTTTNTYDAADNLITQSDAKGQVTSYAYDALNRVTEITLHDGSKQSYVYDQGTNGAGRLSSITETDPSHRITSVIAYTYDQHGRITSDKRTVAGVPYVVAYSYDSAGRLSGMTYPSGRTVSYSFDGLGRVSSIDTAHNGETQSVVRNVSYHPFGGVSGFTFGNGQIYTRIYDQDGRVASYTLGAQTFAIGYDAASRIISISEVSNPANTNAYGYDNLDRLTSASLPATAFGYEYDAVGNRLSRTVGSTTETYSYFVDSNRLSRVSSPSSTRYFTFDANGSTVNDGRNGYVYDVRGRLVEATRSGGTSTYQINALGQRIAKTVPGGSAGPVLFADSFPGPEGRAIDDQLDGLWTGGRTTVVARVNAAGQTEIAPGQHIQSVADFVLRRQGLTLQGTLTRGRIVLLRTGQNEDVIVRYAGDQVAVALAKDDDGGDLTSDADVRQRFQVPAGEAIVVTIDLKPGSARVQITTGQLTFDTGNIVLKSVLEGEPWRIRLGGVRISGVARNGVVDEVQLSSGPTSDFSTTNFVYDIRGNLIAEIPAAGIVKREYAYLDRIPVMVLQFSEQAIRPHFVHTDHINTPRLITDEDQRIVWRWDAQEPFNAGAADEDPSGLGVFESPLRDQGTYLDRETELYYNMNRYRDTSIGRFSQSDPIGLRGGVNPYLYATDPLTQIDPTGLMGRGGTPNRGGYPKRTGPLPPTIECPKTLPPCGMPPEFKAYQGNPKWFHCGYRGFVQRDTPPGHLQQECFYTPEGKLADDWCAGSPNLYDAGTSPLGHTLSDSGGVFFPFAPIPSVPALKGGAQSLGDSLLGPAW